jgi:pimeloyl-ACP methyl ester carboxylesterase
MFNVSLQDHARDSTWYFGTRQMQGLIVSSVVMLALAGSLPWLIRRAYRTPRCTISNTPARLKLPFRNCRIPTANGKYLSGWFIAETDSRDRLPVVVIMHGWGGCAAQMLPFAGLLHQAGYGVLLLDARNHGSSDSDGFSSMPRFAEDLESGLNWLKEQPRTDPHRLFLLGHSVGAAAALLLASRRQDLAGMISIASFAHPRELMRRQMQSHHIPYYPIGWLILRYIERTIGFSFDEIAPGNTIRHIECPVLLIHGRADSFIPMEDSKTIYANRGGENVHLLLLDGAGHNSIEALSRHAEALLHFMNDCSPRHQDSEQPL